MVVLQELKKSAVKSDDHPDIKNCIQDSIFQTFGLRTFDIILLPQGTISKTSSGKIMRSENRMRYLNGEFIEVI